MVKSAVKRKKKRGQPEVDSKSKGPKQNKTIYSINSMEMVRTEEIDKNQPICILLKLQKSWEFLSVPMGLTVSPAHWLAQHENTQSTHKMKHLLVNKYMSQEGYIKENSVANPLKHHQWVSHPLVGDIILQQSVPAPLLKVAVWQSQ